MLKNSYWNFLNLFDCPSNIIGRMLRCRETSLSVQCGWGLENGELNL